MREAGRPTSGRDRTGSASAAFRSSRCAPPAPTPWTSGRTAASSVTLSAWSPATWPLRSWPLHDLGADMEERTAEDVAPRKTPPRALDISEKAPPVEDTPVALAGPSPEKTGRLQERHRPSVLGRAEGVGRLDRSGANDGGSGSRPEGRWSTWSSPRSGRNGLVDPCTDARCRFRAEFVVKRRVQLPQARCNDTGDGRHCERRKGGGIWLGQYQPLRISRWPPRLSGRLPFAIKPMRTVGAPRRRGPPCSSGERLTAAATADAAGTEAANEQAKSRNKQPADGVSRWSWRPSG